MSALTDALVEKLARRDVLSDEEREILAGLPARTASVARGTTIVAEGDRPSESCLLVDGFAARRKSLASGARQYTELNVAGDFVDLHSLLVRPLDHDIVALSACTLAYVPHERLRAVTERHAHLTRVLWLNTLIDGAIHREWLVTLGRGTAETAMGRLFCEVYLRLEAVGRVEEGRCHFPLTQEDVSDLLGLSAVHVNRTLQELRGRGLVELRNGALTIKDWDGLARAAEFDPSYLNLTREPR